MAFVQMTSVPRSWLSISLKCFYKSLNCNVSSMRTYVTEAALKSRYGGRHIVTMLEGDGIGPEMMNHVKSVLKVCNAPISFENIAIGRSSTDDEFEHAILACKRNGVALKGNIESKRPGIVDSADSSSSVSGTASRNMKMRVALDLFAYVQRCKSIPGVETKHSDVDLTVIRENTEGEYSSLENESVPGVVESLKIITERKSRRIAKFAFDYAVRENRKKVTVVHKANIMKLADGLFLETCNEVAKLYPNIEVNSMIVDNCCMQLVSRPQQFDVMVMPNLYGNVIGNLGAGLVGGAGVTSGTNVGHDCVVFESGTRNSASNLVGKNEANPAAMLFAACDLLQHLEYFTHAKSIRTALVNVIGKRHIRTPDLGGTARTTDIVAAVQEEIS